MPSLKLENRIFKLIGIRLQFYISLLSEFNDRSRTSLNKVCAPVAAMTFNCLSFSDLSKLHDPYPDGSGQEEGQANSVLSDTKIVNRKYEICSQFQ